MGKKIISAIIIYGDGYDKELLELAKKSVSWCYETILVNGIRGSFSDWRNEGLKRARGEWILYIDTDEEVSSTLREEILSTVNSSPSTVHAFAMPRRNFIFGQEFKYSGQYPDYQKRLFLRSKFKKWVGDLHEEPEFEGEIRHMNNSLIHYKNITISQMIEKTNKWSEIEAQLMFDEGHPKMNILRFVSVGFRELFLRFIKERAFLDGKKGIIYGIYQIYSRLISYSKLWEKQAYIIHT